MVLSHKFNSNEFIAYEITAGGVNTTPVESAVVNGSEGGAREIKISPNGNKVAVARHGDLSEVQIFDFNTSTGIVSNPVTLYNPSSFASLYGVKFPDNSKVLYIIDLEEKLHQFDLDAGNETDIINSRTLIQIDNDVNYLAVQLGPDGKLYITKIAQYLDIIEDPNMVGLDCNCVFDGIYLDGREAQPGLPLFIQSFFQIGFQVQDVCESSATQFSSNISQVYDALIWDFGDGNP